jgi:hypothetical protein
MAVDPTITLMNSRRRMYPPKLRRQHPNGSSAYFDRGLKPASKPLPQCTANERVELALLHSLTSSASKCSEIISLGD